MKGGHSMIEPLGDSAVIVRFGTEMNEMVHKNVKAFTDELSNQSFEGFIECVSSFTTVTVYYKKRSYKSVCSQIEEIRSHLSTRRQDKPRIVDIPVWYGGEYGPDLKEVAVYHGLTEKEVIRIHTEGEYLVYMIGFAPGFPYLGGLSDKIATPRRKTPRLKIPAGSIGIAGAQTGIYPISTPGGWQIIGRTDISLFNAEQNPPSVLKSGDIVKFVEVSK